MKLNARHIDLHGSERSMDASRISARTDVPLPKGDMRVAKLSTREGGSQFTGRKDPERQTDLTNIPVRRDGSTFPWGDMNNPTVPNTPKVPKVI